MPFSVEHLKIPQKIRSAQGDSVEVIFHSLKFNGNISVIAGSFEYSDRLRNICAAVSDDGSPEEISAACAEESVTRVDFRARLQNEIQMCIRDRAIP